MDGNDPVRWANALLGEIAGMPADAAVHALDVATADLVFATPFRVGDAAPAVVPAAVTDYTTGRLAALGVLCALARRVREGGSWQVRVSLARTAMWIQSLPRVPAGAAPRGLDPAQLAPWMIAYDTAWGRVTRLAPIARMSETPPETTLWASYAASSRISTCCPRSARARLRERARGSGPGARAGRCRTRDRDRTRTAIAR